MKLPTSLRFLALVPAMVILAGDIRAQKSADTDPIYHYSVVDQKPEPKRRVRPDYPASMRPRVPPAELVLGFVVSKTGTVSGLTVIKVEDPDMIDPVYSAYEDAKFTPGTKGGVPVRTRMEVTEIYPQPKLPPSPKPTPSPRPAPDPKTPPKR